jgi:endonuclease/exonuclease/phosphatase family metal-dependent hydrolase
LRAPRSGFGRHLQPALLWLFAANAVAWAWDPPAGDWTKTEPGDLRVMTWNILDGLRTDIPKTEGINQWTSLARIVAALKPDVLLLQECGDASGGVDTVSELNTVIDLFLHGGTDPFLGGPVTAFVQDYDPDFDLPYTFVSTSTDGFNRNVILSRYPFADLNGDTKSQISIPPLTLADAYQGGWTWSSISVGRGFQFAEINLPDANYPGDLVVGNAHFKAQESGSADDLQREQMAKMTAYFVDYLFNGAGTGIPDPNNKIFDSPPATMILDDLTPVVLGGDWNEDEATNGDRGPAVWMTQAEFLAGTDGTDRDRSDGMYDFAATLCSGLEDTQGSSKLDYIAWQDSIATMRLSFIFWTNQILVDVPCSTNQDCIDWGCGTCDTNQDRCEVAGSPCDCGAYPPELGPSSQGLLSGLASDHRPVIVDLILPQEGLAPGACCDDGSCSVLMLSQCNSNGGSYGGDNTSCSDDADGDGVTDTCDACPGFDDDVDPDGDGQPTGCDPCPADNPDDSDGDGVCNSADACPGFDDDIDPDGDGVPTGCDPCPADNPDDTDGDGVCNSADECQGFDDADDPDGDGIPSGCDSCPLDNPDDSDGDGICESADVCPGFNDNVDPDGDDLPTGCDPCPTNPDPGCVMPPCSAAADCADLDQNNVRDDNCLFWSCQASQCIPQAIPFGDMGGAFGACPPDLTTDSNDRFHALNCFSNVDTLGGPGYPCEDAPPSAFNVDAGGSFGACPPDGVCDGNDGFHALNAFSGTTTCDCPAGGPAPSATGPSAVGQAVLRLSVRGTARPGATVAVDVYLDSPLDDLRGYQLHLGASGGRRSGVQLVDIAVEERKDAALPAGAWLAFNVATSQMVAGLDGPGVAAPAGAYLASFYYRIDRQAAGAFAIEVLHDPVNPAHRTFLFPTPAAGMIEILESAPATFSVRPAN